MRAILLACASVLCATGCPGGDDPEVVGTWQEIQTAEDDPSDRQTLTFGDDGALSRTTTMPAGAGTFEIDGDRMVLDMTLGAERSLRDVGYVVVGDQLALGTLTPVGEANGLVGVWQGEVTLDGVHIELDIELRGDQTVSYSATSTEDGDFAFDGTWAEVGGDVVIEYQLDENTTVNLAAKYIAGVAIADELYQRVGGP
jgi:hypothetical protein